MALKKINYTGSSKVILRLCEMVNQLIDGGGGGGSTVTYTQTLSSGTKTGSISIDGVSTDMYAPTQPTKLSDLQNDTNFIDNTVNNLVNYYKKTETYTQAEVDALISAIVTLNILVVQTLPTQDISTTTIYLVPKQTAGTDDVYDEYLYINNAWEHIGTTQIDLSNYYTKAQVDTLLADKVDKVAGKQLSTEDFTSALKTKLDGIATGAEVNVQSDWSQNDNTADDYIKNKPSIPTALSDLTEDTTHRVVTDTEKSTWNGKSDFSGSYNDLTDKPTIPDAQIQSDWSQTDNTEKDYIKNKPTKLSDFSNDTNFITNTVSNLTNYYLKSETYTQAEVNALVAGISGLNYLVVQTLPTQDISTTTIYLVPKATALTDDVYDEYLYINNAWECIGSTTVDLSNYYTKSQTDTLLNAKVSDNPTFTEASTRANIASGESFATILGKIKKWFTDLPSMFVSKSGDTMTGSLNISSNSAEVLLGCKTHTNTASQLSHITIGNNINDGTAGASHGGIILFGKSNRYALLQASNINSSHKTIELPNASGTLALTSDIAGDDIYNAADGNNKITRKHFTSSGSGTSSDQWIKVLEMSLTAQYSDAEFDITINNKGTTSSVIDYIRLIGRIKQQNAMSGNPSYRLSAVSWIGLAPSQCRLYLTSNTSSLKKVELWVKNNATYQNLKISANYADGVVFSGLAGELPSTVYAECQVDSVCGNAIKATQDGDGNDIVSTYVTKSVVGGYAKFYGGANARYLKITIERNKRYGSLIVFKGSEISIIGINLDTVSPAQIVGTLGLPTLTSGYVAFDFGSNYAHWGAIVVGQLSIGDITAVNAL